MIAYAAEGPYGSFRRRCLSPPGLTGTILQTCGPEVEKGDVCWGGNSEIVPLWHMVGGYGYASDSRRQRQNAGSAALTVPHAPIRSDGEPSERTSQARVQTRSAHSLPCKGESEDRGRRQHRVFGPPPVEDRDDLRRQRPQGRLRVAKRVFFPSGFSIHVGDFGPLHPFTIIPTASSGEASATAAHPRFGAAGWAAASRSLRGSGRGYEYG